MRPAKIVTALLVALVAGVVSWVALNTWTGSGGNPPPLPWASVAGTAALVAIVIAAGIPVRRWVRGRRDRPLDPLVAARSAVLGKAAAYGGAVLTGWYLSQAAVVLPDLVGVRRERLFVALVATVAAVGLSAAGFVVQYWCRIPPSDDDDAGTFPDEDRDSVG